MRYSDVCLRGPQTGRTYRESIWSATESGITVGTEGPDDGGHIR